MELPMASNIPHIHSEDDISNLVKLDLTFASQNLNRFCKYLKEFDHPYPCKQIAEAQENLKMCFHILVENYLNYFYVFALVVILVMIANWQNSLP